jgi:hypothetical protein
VLLWQRRDDLHQLGSLVQAVLDGHLQYSGGTVGSSGAVQWAVQ